jgi:cytochrome P450
LADIDNGSGDESFVNQFILASKAPPERSTVDDISVEKSNGKSDGAAEKTKRTLLSRDELLFTVRDFIVAGTDTSLHTQRWLMGELANHPHVQASLHEEIDRVVGRDRQPSLDDEASMPYTQAVILEIMRRRTLVPRALLHRTLCNTSIGDLFIPANTMVNISSSI